MYSFLMFLDILLSRSISMPTERIEYKFDRIRFRDSHAPRT